MRPIMTFFVLLFVSTTPMLPTTQVDETTPKPSPHPSGPPEVLVKLLRPVEELRGIDVPKTLKMQRSDSIRIQKPASLTIESPDGAKRKSPSIFTSIGTDDGLVTYITFSPMPRTADYKSTVAELRRLLKEFEIRPSPAMEEEMARWPEDAPGIGQQGVVATDFYRANTHVSDQIDLTAEVRGASSGGWFLSLTFAANTETMRAIWEARERREKDSKEKQ